MKPNEKQLQVMRYLSTKESATSDEIYKNVRFGYYHNASKHLSDLLSRMVKQGFITRVSKGVFKLGGRKQVLENKNQLSIEL